MKKSFTLIEVLVAMLLLSVLISTSFFAYKSLMNTFYKIKTSKIKTSLNYYRLYTAVSNLYYYTVYNYDSLDKKYKFRIFFKGNENSMTFITKSPLFSNSISVVSIFCSNNNLKYREKRLYEEDYLKPSIDEKDKIISLFPYKNSCKIKYKFEQNDETIPRIVLFEIDDKKYVVSIKSKNQKFQRDLTEQKVLNVE